MDDYFDRSHRDIIATKINPLSIISPRDYNKKNKEKTWKYGKHTEYDKNFICISKDGSLGEIWKVGDLLIGLPSAYEKPVLNSELPDKDSVWKRTEIPQEFVRLETKYKRDMRKNKGYKRNEIKAKYVQDKSDLEKKYQDFINLEFKKRKEGIFVKIDNEVMYLTGENYMFLNYYYLAEDKIYPNFRVTAVHTWWHWEAVCADKDVWGELRLKSRRVAWTSEVCSIALNKFTITRYAEIPIVSETDRLAKKLFTGKIVNPFKYYPTYFKPLIEQPNEKVKNNLEITFDTDDQETSVISFYPTKDVAYDSTKASPLSINDEVGKYTNVAFTEFRGNHADCHKQGSKIVSTGKFGSTAGEFSSGGESFQYEFENASAKVRDKFGSTNTGLISLFVDDCYTMAGFFDKFGYPIVNDPVEPIENEYGDIIEYGSVTFWNAESEKKKLAKKSDYNNFLRQHPRTPDHAFRNEGGIHNDFDIDNLNTHEEHLKAIPDDVMVGKVFRGNLDWEGEPYKSNVIWIPNTKGKFYTTWIPPKDLQNQKSEKIFHGRRLIMPDNNHIGCLGVDSYDIIGQAGDGKGSDGAIVGYTKFSMTGAPTKSFFLKYKERPEKRDDFYDDVIMACQFFGMYALIESNKARLLEYMYDKGFTGYALRRQDKKWDELTKAEQKWGGIPSSTPVIEDQTSLLKDYIVDNVGQNLETDCKVYFIDLIQEWIKLNPKKRKEFDLGVASGMAIMGAQYRVKQRKIANISSINKGLGLSSFSA